MKLTATIFTLFLGISVRAQYDPTWARQICDPLEAQIRDVAADSSGNIYVCGNLASKNYFGNTSSDEPDTVVFINKIHEIPSSEAEAFLAKFNSDGQLLWSHFIQGKMVFQRIAIATFGKYLCRWLL